VCADEVDDSGAFYTGRQWQQRGNVVRFSTFRHIRARVKTFLGSPSVQGLYLDDQMSGCECTPAVPRRRCQYLYMFVDPPFISKEAQCCLSV